MSKKKGSNIRSFRGTIRRILATMNKPGMPFLCLFFVLAAAGAIWLILAWPRHPMTVNVVEVGSAVDAEQKWVELRLEFTRRGPEYYEFFVKGLTVQTRSDARWAQPERFFGFVGEHSFLSTNRVSVSLMIPRETDACRFVLAYHIGDSPHAKAQKYCLEHGWMTSYPQVCNWVLRVFPDRIPWKQTKLEVALFREQPRRSWSTI